MDKHIFKRLLILDSLLSEARENNGFSREEIRNKVNERLRRNYGIEEEVDRHCIARDLKLLYDAGYKYSEKLGTATGNVRKVKLLKYEEDQKSLFDVSLTENEKNLISEAVSLLGMKGVSNLSAFRNLQSMAGRGHSIISFTKSPKEKISSKYFDNLLGHIKRGEVISIRMKDRITGKLESKQVHPWFIHEYNRRWYLFGYDEKEQVVEHFALDRIVAAPKVLRKTYKKPYLTIEDILSDIIGVTVNPADPEVYEIIFWVSASEKDYVLSKPLHVSQPKNPLTKEYIREKGFNPDNFGEGIFLSLRCKINYELERDMIAVGPDLIVLSPEKLRNTLKDKLKCMVNNYNKPLV